MLGSRWLEQPNQQEEFEIRAPSGRYNRVRVRYNDSCTDVSVDVLERYDNMCFNFNDPRCSFGNGFKNCDNAILWTFNGQQFQRGQNNNDCVETSPQAEGWVQYHTQSNLAIQTTTDRR